MQPLPYSPNFESMDELIGPGMIVQPESIHVFLRFLSFLFLQFTQVLCADALPLNIDIGCTLHTTWPINVG